MKLLISHFHISFGFSIQCDKTARTGPAIVFDIGLVYPNNFTCQTLICQINLFTEINQKFQTVENVEITTTDGKAQSLERCRTDTNVKIAELANSQSSFTISGKLTVSFPIYQKKMGEYEISMNPTVIEIFEIWICYGCVDV